jgi:hypothetical protein
MRSMIIRFLSIVSRFGAHSLDGRIASSGTG